MDRSSIRIDSVDRLEEPDFEPSAEEPNANILLVDDRSENLEALAAVLEPLGENLVLAHSGEDALRRLLKEDYAVILMDAQMPGLDGFETAALIRDRERTSHVPIIFVTAYNKDARHVFRGYSVGAVDYIGKPFDPDILRSKVKVFVDLYKKSEQVRRQAEIIHRIELREAAEALQREHIRRLNAELERQVQERTRELLEANREMEAFCYSVSHDLRAPLRAVMSTSRMLLEDVEEKLAEGEREMLYRQAAAAKRLGNLIDDLLLLSRLGRRNLQRDELDLTQIAREVVLEVSARWQEALVTYQVQDGLRACADPGLARILLDNLLDNATKYSPNGGAVVVGAEENEQGHYFFVRDEGIGFDMQYAPKLFLPFERLHREDEYEGTGIGLASVHRIVTRHGGSVWAESEPGKGAKFCFTLPEPS